MPNILQFALFLHGVARCCAFSPTPTSFVAYRVKSRDPRSLGTRASLPLHSTATIEGTPLRLQLAGKLLPTIQDTILEAENFGRAARLVCDVTFLKDIVLISGLWLAAPPIIKSCHKFGNFVRKRFKHKSITPYEKSLPLAISNSLVSLSKLLMILYATDILLLGIAAFNIRILPNLPSVLATIAKPIWLAMAASEIKRWALGVMPAHLEEVPASSFGRKLVYNRLADFALYFTCVVVGLDLLSVELGVALSSLLAFGGLSSVVIALACQEPLSHLVFGLLFVFSDKFRPGEEVKFGDISGFISSMGWFDTSVRRYDESTVIIPNGKIMGVPITNLSRQRWGQYKADLRIRYDDLDKVELVVENVKKGLSSLAPGVILPPTRALWVHFRTFEKDCVVISIDIKLRAPGGSEPYYVIREKCNLKISEAIRSAGSEFAYPTSRRV